MTRIFYVLLFLLPNIGFAQIKTIGTSQILNFPKSVYRAETQNWGIAQDRFGFMYFANNGGVLRFDGTHWENIETAGTAPVRSILVDKNNRVFVGTDNDFGYIGINGSGKFVYHSLRHFLTENIEFDDVWKIHEYEGSIIFQSFDYIFVYRESEIEILRPKNQFQFSFVANGRFFVEEPKIGLFELVGGQLELLPWSQKIKGYEIWSVLPHENNALLISTRKHGIFLFDGEKLLEWKSEVDTFIQRNKIYSAAEIVGGYYAFGTILDGVAISDRQGNILQHIGKSDGLQNNTVLSLFPDDSGNLWLGLDNGIDYVEINSPLSTLSGNDGLGTGYALIVHNNFVYAGTNQGLFVKPYELLRTGKGNFELIQNTAGQVWSLEVFDGELLCGHNSGTFRIEGKKAEKISDEPGAWRFSKLKGNTDLLLGGNYNGLFLLKKGKNGWEHFYKMNGFYESSRYFYQDQNADIWVSHGEKGVYRITLDEKHTKVAKFSRYGTNNGLPGYQNNIVLSYQNEGFVTTPEGIFQYQPAADSFAVSEKYNAIFNVGSQLKAFEQDREGNLWYIAQNGAGVLRLNEDYTFTNINIPFKPLNDRFVANFEFVYPINENNVFFGIDNGFAHYSSSAPKSYTDTFNAYITTVEMPYIDSVIYQREALRSSELKFPYRKNVFRFHFTSPFFESPRETQFTYWLEGFADDWSGWTTDSYKDFTNLDEGKYVFKLKAKNVYGAESGVSTFAFNILPPWYRSRVAVFSYVMALVLLVMFLVFFVFNRMELSERRERQRNLAEMKEIEVRMQRQKLLAEQEIMQLRNEKLSAEMVHRDKELANQTMGIIQKNKFLQKLNQEIQRIQRDTEDGAVKSKMAVLKKRIDREVDNKQQNQIFETYFDEVHHSFFKRLKEQYPNLSPKDLRLCAYIRMDITTKEIATLLNITDRGVEISRYRLRKKLRLERETNLSTFLSNI